MNELLLSTDIKNNTKNKYNYIAPIGSVISSCSTWRKIEKWCEIVCDLSSPQKREMYEPNNCPSSILTIDQWKYITDIWSDLLRTKFFNAEKQKGYDKIIAFNNLWNNDIISIDGWVSAMGKEPNGYDDVVNTWLWSNHERKNFFIVVNDDLTKLDVELLPQLEITSKNSVITINKKIIDWENELELSFNSILDIKNKNKIINPRFDKPVSSKIINKIINKKENKIK